MKEQCIFKSLSKNSENYRSYSLLFKLAHRQNQPLLSLLKFQNTMTVIMILNRS